MRRVSQRLFTSAACRVAAPVVSAATCSTSFATPSAAITSSSIAPVQQYRFCSSNEEEPQPFHTMKREDLKDPIHQICYDLIHQARIVIFLTGTPDEPRCGFTRALCQILSSLEIEFSYVDIMESDEICEGLKEYSGWPTYPQVYVDQELVGGFDIVSKMCESGEFQKLLRGKNLMK